MKRKKGFYLEGVNGIILKDGKFYTFELWGGKYFKKS
jgi:hypothetical protein